MRVCLICEGSYPFVPGGVSSWVQMLCTQFSDIEFVIWAIATTREEMSEYAYPIPENVKEIRTQYLGEAAFKKSGQKVRLTRKEKEALKGLMGGSVETIDWAGVLDLAKRHPHSMSDLLMSEAFYDVCLEEYQRQNSKKVLLHFLWNFRGIYFPLMHLLSQDIPKADVYHAVSAGYAGMLGSCASYIEGVPLLLSEHGIYTREREEDIIRSNWVAGEFKELWIDFFKKLSFIAYQQASLVTTLFETNRSLQIELQCPPEKIAVIPNGVNADDFALCRKGRRPANGLGDSEGREASGGLGGKSVSEDSDGSGGNGVPGGLGVSEGSGGKSVPGGSDGRGPMTLGAVLRVVPIKDVKTMLLAFDVVKRAEPDVRLKIMGNCAEDPVYYQECRELLEELGTADVEFLGQVNIKEHLPEIDLLLLSSISEGQPLAILEGLAAEIPFVATNVGDCRALLEGEQEDDQFGPAGVVVPVMNSEAMAQAILHLVRNPDLVARMGQAGRKRVETYYGRREMLGAFRTIYEQLGEGAHGRNRI